MFFKTVDQSGYFPNAPFPHSLQIRVTLNVTCSTVPLHSVWFRKLSFLIGMILLLRAVYCPVVLISQRKPQICMKTHDTAPNYWFQILFGMPTIGSFLFFFFCLKAWEKLELFNLFFCVCTTQNYQFDLHVQDCPKTLKCQTLCNPRNIRNFMHHFVFRASSHQVS